MFDTSPESNPSPAMAPTTGALAWWVMIGAIVASPNSDYWDCNSAFNIVINGAYAVGVVLIGLTLFGTARAISRRWWCVGIVGLSGATVAAFSNTLEHCVSAPLGISYAIGSLVMLLGCIALGIRLLLTRSARLEGVAFIIVGAVPFQLGERFAWAYAVGLTFLVVVRFVRARRDSTS